MSPLSAKKLLMVGGQARPFEDSGSFESGLDGFDGGSRRENEPRTGRYSVDIGDGSIQKYFEPKKVKNLLVTFSVYGKNVGDGQRSITGYASIDGGPYAAIQTFPINTPNGPYVFMSWSVKVPSKSSLSIRVSGNGANIRVDDWRVEGRRR